MSDRFAVNGSSVQPGYVIKVGDVINCVVHRHEAPVTGSRIEVLHDSDEVLVVNKPCSVPIHPCSYYKHNSLLFILAKDYGYRNLRLFYRLDGLTSGLVIFAKNDSKHKSFHEALQSSLLHKEYLCRVAGEFPTGIVSVKEPIQTHFSTDSIHRYVDPAGKHSHTHMKLLKYLSQS